MARLCKVLETHCEGGFGADHAIDLSAEPWCYCSLETVKLLIGFAYLGICKQTKRVLAATQMREAVALMDLCDYLMSAGDSEVGANTRGPQRSLKTLHQALTEHVQAKLSR